MRCGSACLQTNKKKRRLLIHRHEILFYKKKHPKPISMALILGSTDPSVGHRKKIGAFVNKHCDVWRQIL